MKTTATNPLEEFNSLTTAFAVPGSDTIIDVMRSDGTSWHYRETLDQMRLRYPGVEVVNISEFCTEKASRQDSPIHWSEISKDRYWEMLEVLPPAAMGNGGFLVGEPWDHHATSGQPRFAGYREKSGRYWEANRPMTRKEFAAEMLKPARTLFGEIVAAGIKHASHETDLYLPDTEEVRAILDRFPISKLNATRFQNQVEGGTWIDVPFAYLPAWEAKQRKKS